MPVKYQKSVQGPLLKKTASEHHKQRLFKERAGFREIPMQVMKVHCQKIEQCNRLLALVRQMKLFATEHPGYRILHLDYALLNCWFPKDAGQIALDLSSLGVPLSYPLPFGRLISFEKMIGARKGAYRKKDKHYRNISNHYRYWADRRDPFGNSLQKV